MHDFGLVVGLDFTSASRTFGNSVSSEEEDAFVTKLNPTGTAMVYSTYLGRDDND